MRHHAEHCFTESIGEAGVSRQRVQELARNLTAAHLALKEPGHPARPLIELPLKRSDLAAVHALAATIRRDFSQTVVIGSGGSGLSGKVFAAMAPFAPLRFIDTIDPDVTAGLLAMDLSRTCFLIVSKSGATVETLAQFYVLLARANTVLGADAARHFIVITGAGENPLRNGAVASGIQVLDFDASVTGRFSSLTVAGLLPAAIAGLDIEALRRGALAAVSDVHVAKTPLECKSAMGAALHYAFIEKGRNISVMMPYAEKLSGFSAWYRQSWAESLGKSGKGTTPVCAMGTTDQHSQLQLYLDGPADKLFHLICINRKGTGQPIPGSLDCFAGKTTGDVMEAQQRATVQSLAQHKRPVRLLELDELKEEQLGELLMHFTFEIIFMGHLLGVDPFGQPVVEESKKRARHALLEAAA